MERGEEEKSQLQIRVFVSAIIILVLLWIGTGVLTHILPKASYENQIWTLSDEEGISFWKWLLAPIMVLFSDGGGLVIAIIVFLLVIGGAVHVLQVTGLVGDVILKIANRFEDKKWILLAMLTFFFMSLGAFIGVFEEVVPLAPLILVLSRKMGWDDLTGMGISILACGLGFSAAVTNPFTIGVAQELAELPVFSGAGLRIGIFLSVYLVLVTYLYFHVKRNGEIGHEGNIQVPRDQENSGSRGQLFFVTIMAFMLVYVLMSPFLDGWQDNSLMVIACAFLISAIGVGWLNYKNMKKVLKILIQGALNMAPAILLVLLATSIKYVMVEGKILDTILYISYKAIKGMNGYQAIILIFLMVMFLNFFIGSGSAKAFIIIPIIMPILDYLGMGRQLGILAFQFGDGFSNILYPTNAVLLISLSLMKIPFSRWFKFIMPLEVFLMLLSALWLILGYAIGYGQ